MSEEKSDEETKKQKDKKCRLILAECDVRTPDVPAINN